MPTSSNLRVISSDDNDDSLIITIRSHFGGIAFRRTYRPKELEAFIIANVRFNRVSLD